MKNIRKILLIFILLISLLFTFEAIAVNVEGLDKYNDNHIEGTTPSISNTISVVGMRFLSSVKYIFSGVFLIIIVYAGALLVVSMGTDEDKLSQAKRTLWYSMVGLIFINMPGTIYNAIKGDRPPSIAGGIGSTWSNDITSSTSNLFINTDVFAATINNTIVRFLKIGLVGIAVMIVVLSGIKIITSAGSEDKVSEAKGKILWAVIGLIFVGFIEAWQRFVYSGNISGGVDIFDAVANLALFLAVPVAIFFLTLAGYYYITAAGDEEKTKKGKNIIVNTVLATAVLLVSYIFLNDLITI